MPIMNKIQIILLACVLLNGCNSNTGQKQQESGKPMNVLFIVADDLNKTLGCYGHPLVQTPNIDRLASQGIQFDHAYCNFAVCNPSRSSFLTGMKPETTNILDNVVPLQSVIGDWVSLPALFRNNGYHTVNLGKIFHRPEPEHNDVDAWDEMHFFGTSEPGTQGVHRNLTDGELKWCWWQAAEGNDLDQPDGKLAAKAVDIIRAGKEKPFFLAVGLHKPHDPFIAPKKYFDLYPLDICTPLELPASWNPPYPHTLPPETEQFNRFDEQDKREFLRSYYACTSFMDAQVGKVLDALEETGQNENTLILFLGDHGYHLGEHNWWNKVTLFEQGTSAPFIMAGPVVMEKGVRSPAMFEFIDIYPTLAELCKLENIPGNLQGKSFASVVDNPSSSFRTEVHALIKRDDILGKSVKNTKWRYVEWDDGQAGKELYDQVEDPMEYFNLAEDPQYQSICAEMQPLLYN